MGYWEYLQIHVHVDHIVYIAQHNYHSVVILASGQIANKDFKTYYLIIVVVGPTQNLFDSEKWTKTIFQC